MTSTETERRLKAAFAIQGTYTANDTERAKIADTTLVAFVGGVAVGKNYMMHESGFHIVGTETSRQPRRGDDPAKYTYATNQAMLDAISHREYIQYGVHLPDLIYATRANHYKLRAINSKDIWFNAVEQLKNKGFKSVKSISILMPGEQWQDYLDDRFYDRSPDYITDRLSEAAKSIEWSLQQHLSHDKNHLLIVNDDQQTAGNLDRIRQFAHGEQVEPLGDMLAREIVDQMLSVIHSYQTQEQT